LRVKLEFEALDVLNLTVTLEGNDPLLIDDLVQLVRQRVKKEETPIKAQKYEEV